MAIETTTFDPARYLASPEAQAELLTEAMDTGDPAFIGHALGVIARARGMSQVAREVGLTREGLYRALSTEGNPSFATVAKVAKVLGFHIEVRPSPSQ